MGVKGKVRRVLMRKLEGKKSLARPSYGDENIKMDFTEISWDFSDGFIWLRKGTIRGF
jgi:hypothetical protein